jgi:hypothetical protein
MGQVSSRQTKDLVPASRITKDLARFSRSVGQSLRRKYVAVRPYFYCDKLSGSYWTLSGDLFLGWNEAVAVNSAISDY